MTIPLKTAGITRAATGNPLTVTFLSLYIAVAARKLARVPKIISVGIIPTETIFASRHPTVSPGIADGVKSASVQRDSDSLN